MISVLWLGLVHWFMQKSLMAYTCTLTLNLIKLTLALTVTLRDAPFDIQEGGIEVFWRKKTLPAWWVKKKHFTHLTSKKRKNCPANE